MVGLAKVSGSPMMVEMFATIGQWFRYVIGALEIARGFRDANLAALHTHSAPRTGVLVIPMRSSLFALRETAGTVASVVVLRAGGPASETSGLQRLADGGGQATDPVPQPASALREGLTPMAIAQTSIEANRILVLHCLAYDLPPITQAMVVLSVNEQSHQR
jgi:hypothetical protein